MVKNIAKVYKKTNLHQQGNDFTYWQGRPYAERIAVLEEIRREYQVWEQSTRGETDKDLDIWVELSRDNAVAIIKALAQFGMSALGLSEEDFLAPDQVVQIGFPPNRIDILVSISGVEFSECFARRVEVILDGVNVHFIDLEHLKQNKKASGHLQDLADLENLE
jgi:hypothetical protein